MISVSRAEGEARSRDMKRMRFILKLGQVQFYLTRSELLTLHKRIGLLLKRKG